MAEWHSWAFAGNEPSLVETHIDFAYERHFSAAFPRRNPRREVDGGFTIIGQPPWSTLHYFSRRDRGIIFGWSLQRALHPPLAEAEQHPNVFISSPSLFTYTSFTRFRVPPRRASSPSTKCNPRKARPGGFGNHLLASDIPWISRSIENLLRLIAKSEITYLLFSIGYD